MVVKDRLRPYQLAHHDHAVAALDDGQSPVLSLFTGAGKTFTADAIIESRQTETLWLADTSDLVKQGAAEAVCIGLWLARATWNLLKRWCAKRRKRGETGDAIDELEAALQRKNPDKDYYRGGLECRTYAWLTTQLRSHRGSLPGRWKLVVCDEGDLAVATKTAEALKLIGCQKLCLTATPFRGDDRPLGELFDGLVKLTPSELAEVGLAGETKPRCMTVRDGIALDWLTDARVFRLTFEEYGNPGSYINTPEHRAHLWRAWEDKAGGRITLAVFGNIDDAEDFAETGRQLFGADICQAVHMRSRHTLADFKAGKFTVAATVAKAYRGIDHPPVSALLFAVDTKSLNRQFQFLGRGLRQSKATGKEDCVVIVASGAYDNLPMTLFDSIQGPIKDPETITEAGNGLGVDADDDEMPTVTELCSRLEEVRLWRRRVAAVKTLPWVTADGALVLCLRRRGEMWRRSSPELLIVRLASWSEKVCVVQRLWHDRCGRPDLELIIGSLKEPDAVVHAEHFAADHGWRQEEPGDVRGWFRRWVSDTAAPSPGLLRNLYWHWLWSSRQSMDLKKTAAAMVRWHLGETDDSTIGGLAARARAEAPIPATHGEAVKRHRSLIACGALNP
jgi:superfamily II DNA or RNA helicase